MKRHITIHFLSLNKMTYSIDACDNITLLWWNNKEEFRRRTFDSALITNLILPLSAGTDKSKEMTIRIAMMTIIISLCLDFQHRRIQMIPQLAIVDYTKSKLLTDSQQTCRNFSMHWEAWLQLLSPSLQCEKPSEVYTQMVHCIVLQQWIH